MHQRRIAFAFPFRLQPTDHPAKFLGARREAQRRIGPDHGLHWRRLVEANPGERPPFARHGMERIQHARRRDFPVTHWFYADALCDWYKVQPFEEAFWRVLAPYLADVAAHGQDTLYVPMFTPPLFEETTSFNRLFAW